MPQKKHSPSKRKTLLLTVSGIVISLAAVVALAVFLIIPHEEKQPGITEQIFSFSGYTRVIEQQEYDFYEHLARRQMDDLNDSERLAQKTRELAQTANAQFYLGNKLGLSGPYSFENMQLQMKHENARRKMNKEKGEAIYGPESFDIYRYYQYVTSNLEVDLIDYLAKHSDKSLELKAKSYFEKNEMNYTRPDRIIYSISENGSTEEHTLDWRQLNSLEKADPELGGILKTGSENQEFAYTYGSMQRKGKILSATYVPTDFEQQKTAIVSDYLKSGYYKELLQEVGKNNPVAFIN